jgi:DivIVA domain-containing protein
MKKKDTTSSGTSEWSSAPTGRITPLEVQQKEFRVARFGAGYRMREVDEFLDQVTDALSVLIAENERLVQGSGDPEPASSRASVRPTTDDADRAAVEAFLRREKGFLQDLGGLVQEHAEELRSMVRSVRKGAPAAAAASAGEGSTVAPAAASVMVEATAAPEAVAGSEVPPEEIAEDADAIGATEQTTPATDIAGSEGSDEGTDEGTDDEGEDEGDDDREPSGGSAMTITGAPADEPIRLDDPEPARSGRQDEQEDGSLKELFWGEE